MSSINTHRSSPLSIPSYRERDPLLQWTPLQGRTPPRTPPPSYYQSAAPTSAVSGFYNTLPSYQEAAGGHRSNGRSNNIQDTSASGEGFFSPEPRPNAYGGLAAMAFFCCCFSPLACVALYYSARVNYYYEAGEYTRAKKASKRTFAYSILAIIVGFLLLLILSSSLFCGLYSKCKSSIASIF